MPINQNLNMQKIILFEKNSELNQRIKTELLKTDDNSLVFDVSDSEQLISFITSGKYDCAVINYDQLGSLFKLRPYILKHVSGFTRLFFITPDATPMMTLSFSMLGMVIVKTPEELNSQFNGSIKEEIS
ncbi:MAG: hypothetical protein AMXMBFR48_25210 [Ignavibacteriales bacterium]